MKNTIRQVFHSGKFLVGFYIFLFILLLCIIYPLIITYDPLEMVGSGNFYKPAFNLSQHQGLFK